MCVLDQVKIRILGETSTKEVTVSLSVVCVYRERNAERYSLLRKLTIVEAETNSLELNFSSAEKNVRPLLSHLSHLKCAM